MAFEPQQYSAFEIATKILSDERFYFQRNIYGHPIFSYWLRRGKIVHPDGEKSGVHGIVDMSIGRSPLNGKLVADGKAIGELRELLGEEARKSFYKEDSELRMRYDYLDESYTPNFPERIMIRMQTKSHLERYPQDVVALKPTDLVKGVDTAFFRNCRGAAFYSMASYAESRGINLELPQESESQNFNNPILMLSNVWIE